MAIAGALIIAVLFGLSLAALVNGSNDNGPDGPGISDTGELADGAVDGDDLEANGSDQADQTVTGDDGNAEDNADSGEPEGPLLDAVPLPQGVMSDITSFGAVGDGVTDDTAAIQTALDQGRRIDGEKVDGVLFDIPLGLYFPPGEYLITEPLIWHGCCVTIQGAGPEESILKLANGLEPFSDTDSPAAVLTTQDGNESFRQHVRDLTINTGTDNPGAIALDFIANNTASVDNVHLVSGDGAGMVGLDMSRQWPGPLLVQDVTVDGFAIGIRTKHNEYGPTFERITLTNQTEAAMLNEGNIVAVRNLVSDNSVPALVTSGSAILIDSELRGGNDNNAAIVNDAGQLYLRNVVSDGYRVTAADEGRDVEGPIREYLGGQPLDLHGQAEASLKLEIEDTPKPTIEPVDRWARYRPGDAGFDPDAFQAVLDSGATTVAVDFGRYQVSEPIEVTVPASVERLVGFSAAIDAKMLSVIVDESADTPLVIDQFNDGITLNHRSDRTVVLSHGRFEYVPGPDAGTLFLEDVLTSGLQVVPGQTVWARQLNVEGYVEGEPRVVNDGGNLWVLGIKTEKPGTVVQTINGGRTEVLGTLVYPATQFSAIDLEQPAFESIDSDFSAIYSVSDYAPNTQYPVQVRDTRSDDTRDLTTGDVDGRHIALYVGEGRSG